MTEATTGLTAKSRSPNPLCTGSSGANSCNAVAGFDFSANAGFTTYSAGGDRYLSGAQLFRAFVYVVGGFANNTSLGAPAGSVERVFY
jgi:hypothetical protein